MMTSFQLLFHSSTRSMGTTEFLLLFTLSLIDNARSRSKDTLTADQYPTELTQLPTACNDLDDGYHWIRPLVDDEDKYPNIYVLCDNGYTILDPSLFHLRNHHHLKKLFTTYNDVTDFVASSKLNDHVTWTEWFLPAEEDTLWAVAEDCKQCVETEDFGDKSTYYMTGNYNGCLWVTKGYCDMDPDTLQCYECTAPFVDEPVSGLCTHMYLDADHPVNSEHDDCVGSSYNADPSIGTDGHYCVCYKPSSSSMVTASKWVLPKEDRRPRTNKNRVIPVYADDFSEGTFRIKYPGIYTLMEDVELEMNAGNNEEPNAEGAWYPREDQERQYMGAGGTFIGPYAMGFFAGFAIESDDVTIDLNGHQIGMSKAFHLQQRWFAIIEIGSKAFISGQGPGNFGPYMTYANNVVIKNGVIGRSSHHGIHGNGFTNLKVENVHIRDFEVAGMALNGFVGLEITDVEVGPVYQEVPTLGQYGQARIMLPRLRKVVERNPEGRVQIAYRHKSVTMNEILEELTSEMDAIFRHTVDGDSWEDLEESGFDPDIIDGARRSFENVKGLPSSSTVYGIFLNSYGASVFGISGAPGVSENAVLRNVHIHGLYKDPWEVPRIVLTKGPFNDIMDFTRVTDDGLESTRSRYTGSSYTDAQYALHKLSKDWGILGHSVVGTKVDTWISEGKTMGSAKVRCNGDIMLHVTKGVFGLRVDNVLNLDVDALRIEDLQNIGNLGSYVCGNYKSTAEGGHRNQNFPLQRGYTGTEVHALSMVGSTGKMDGVYIGNVVSARGDAMAMQFFPANEVQLGGDITIQDIHAGAYLDKNLLPSLDSNMPNKIPRSCAISIWTWSDEDGGLGPNKITFLERDGIQAKCLTTHTFCSNSPYDHEAVLPNIESCDGSTIVKDIRGDREGMVYDKYIRHISDVHQKLFTILRDDHNVPNFEPERAFPSVIKKEGVFIGQWMYVVLGLIVVTIGLVMTVWSKLEMLKHAVINDTASSSSTATATATSRADAVENRPLLS